MIIRNIILFVQIQGVDLSNLWRQAAEYHMKKGLPFVAANSLEELLKANQHDKKIIAQLIMACAQVIMIFLLYNFIKFKFLFQFNKDRALSLSKDLPSAEQMSKGLDMEMLQSSSATTISYNKKIPSAKQDAIPR